MTVIPMSDDLFQHTDYSFYVYAPVYTLYIADPNRLYRSQIGSEEQKCEVSEGPVCHQLHNCQACSTRSNCHWDFEQRCKAVGNVTEQQVFLLSTSRFIYHDKRYIWHMQE